jgi:hypothetical protein
MAGDTIFIENWFYLAGKIDGVPSGADQEYQSGCDQD